MTRARIALSLVLAVAGASTYVVLRPKVDLIVVNTTAAPVRVVANGQELQLAPGGQQRLDGLGASLSLRATAVDGGSSLAEIDASCRGAPTWVFSVAPVTTWWAVSKGYGDMAHVGSSCAPFAAGGALFALPEDFLPVIDEPMPLDLRVQKGITGAVRKGLWTDAYVEQAHPRRVWLAVHTNLPAPVRLVVNDEELATLPRGTVAHLERLPGPVVVRAVVAEGPSANEVFEVHGMLEAGDPLAQPPTYVWDVDGLTRFHVVSRRYGPDGGAPPPPLRDFESPGGLFRLPAGFFHEVDAPLPDTWHEARVVEFLWCDTMLAKRAPTPNVPGLLRGPPTRRRDRNTSGAAVEEEEPPFPPVKPDGSDH